MGRGIRQVQEERRRRGSGTAELFWTAYFGWSDFSWHQFSMSTSSLKSDSVWTSLGRRGAGEAFPPASSCMQFLGNQKSYVTILLCGCAVIIGVEQGRFGRHSLWGTLAPDLHSSPRHGMHLLLPPVVLFQILLAWFRSFSPCYAPLKNCKDSAE